MPVKISFKLPEGAKAIDFKVNPTVPDDEIFRRPPGDARPPYLYRYRSLSTKLERKWLRRTITHRELFLAPPDTMNDPFENRARIVTEDGTSVYDALEYPAANDTGLEITGLDTFARFFSDQITHMSFWHKINDALGILSFSELPGQLLMWSHYAENHRGVCLQFRNTVIVDGATAPAPVRYQQEYPNIVVRGSEHTHDELLTPVALTKSSCWDYEREWRLVSLIKGSRRVTYRPESLTGIILGARMRKDDKERVIAWVKQSGDDIALYGSSLRDTEYSLHLYRMK